MIKSHQGPPPLPSNFSMPSPFGVKALFVGYALSMTFVPGLISYLLVTRSGLDSTVLSLLVMMLSIISGFGFYVIGHIGHEGFHFTLSTNKPRSALIGTMFSASIIGFSGVGFYLVHSRHHRNTNAPEDPDYQLFSRFKNIWCRLLFLRMINNRYYMKLLFRLLFKLELPPDLRTVFTRSELVRLGWANVLAQFFWLGLYVCAFIFDPRLFICVVVLPHLATAVISAAIVFAQHGDTGRSLSNNARTHAHPLVTLLMAGTNYHLEHHLYPRVPCWRLRQVHAWLRKSSWAAHNPLLVEHRFWKGFLYCRTRFAYGSLLPSEARSG